MFYNTIDNKAPEQKRGEKETCITEKIIPDSWIPSIRKSGIFQRLVVFSIEQQQLCVLPFFAETSLKKCYFGQRVEWNIKFSRYKLLSLKINFRLIKFWVFLWKKIMPYSVADFNSCHQNINSIPDHKNSCHIRDRSITTRKKPAKRLIIFFESWEMCKMSRMKLKQQYYAFSAFAQKNWLLNKPFFIKRVTSKWGKEEIFLQLL